MSCFYYELRIKIQELFVVRSIIKQPRIHQLILMNPRPLVLSPRNYCSTIMGLYFGTRIFMMIQPTK